VHLGAYLLLRVSPVLDLSPWLGAAVIGLGLITAVYASLVAKVQTDIKSALCFASLTQVGIIVAEIGLASFLAPPWQSLLRYFALVHMLGHACLRTLQFVRAPTLLQDYRLLENALGSRLPRLVSSWERNLPQGLRIWFYRFALERGYLDSWLEDYLLQPFLRILRLFDSLEGRWSRFLSAEAPPAASRPDSLNAPAEDSL
jgi:NAD(P)H-quinone oxidoreductase subunit 5